MSGTRFVNGLLACLLFCGSVHAVQTIVQTQEYLIFSPHRSGLFSIFNAVVGLLNAYEHGELAGLKLEFDDGYYKEKAGTSWWENYCTPLELGCPQNASVRKVTSSEFFTYAFHTEEHLSREEVHLLIQKYIHFHAHIHQRVEDFIDEHFKEERVIGLHFRGTDKRSEAPRVPYEQVTETIQQLIQEQQLSEFQIFVATDEHKFLTYIQKKFPGRVIAISTLRSINQRPIHISRQSPRQQGEDAIVDALLLSRCHTLIRTSSNLSLWSTYFNPQIPVINLNKRF